MPNAISPFVNMARIGSKIAHYQKWPKTFLNLAKSGKSCHTVYMCVCCVWERNRMMWLTSCEKEGMREKEREFCACRLYVCNHFSRTFYETSMKRWLQKTIILSRPNKHEQPVLFFFTSLSLSFLLSSLSLWYVSLSLGYVSLSLGYVRYVSLSFSLRYLFLSLFFLDIVFLFF